MENIPLNDTFYTKVSNGDARQNEAVAVQDSGGKIMSPDLTSERATTACIASPSHDV